MDFVAELNSAISDEREAVKLYSRLIRELESSIRNARLENRDRRRESRYLQLFRRIEKDEEDHLHRLEGMLQWQTLLSEYGGRT